jgi:HD-like signal output (HDOD) protein
MITSREANPEASLEVDKKADKDAEADNAADKVGEALNAQRFQMLEDIALELAGEVVFPTSFEAAIRLRKALQNSNLPIPRIASIVSVEPLVAAKLIHLANSVLYSPDGTPARDLQAAISRLGVKLVRTTALTIAMSQLMRSKEMAIFSDFTQALWTHTLKTAATARILARTQTRINPDEAMLAGLVHDLGAFYMLYRAAQYPELRTRPDTVKYLILQWHEGIGVTLLHALGIPEDIVNAAMDHEQPRATPENLRTLADVVYVANILAGTKFECLYQDSEPETGTATIVGQKYAELLPEIESATKEMQAIFA